MIDIKKVVAYNTELKEGLREMYTMLPPGQQKKALKNDKVRACLIRFGIIKEARKAGQPAPVPAR